MGSDISDFEKNVQREINAFLKPSNAQAVKLKNVGGDQSHQKPTGEAAASRKTGHIVKLAVRTKKLELDTIFEHQSASISKLEAQLEAEKAARAAGFPIFGHVVEIRRL